MSDPYTYRFADHDWLANMAGFNKPTDVYYGNILLGVIESRPDGYVVIAIIGPHRPEIIKQGGVNKFKSKNLAADVMHKVWSHMRKPNMQHPTEPENK